MLLIILVTPTRYMQYAQSLISAYMIYAIIVTTAHVFDHGKGGGAALETAECYSEPFPVLRLLQRCFRF